MARQLLDCAFKPERTRRDTPASKASKKGKKSRNKGKRGEREWAKWLSDRGFAAKRGMQNRGGPDSPDVVCPGLPIHWEVKRAETLNIDKALAQAKKDRKDNLVSAVAHKKNNGQWVVLMSADDWLFHYISGGMPSELPLKKIYTRSNDG